MHILTARWTEPCDGSEAYTVQLSDAEAERLQSVLDWLEEHAGDDYGHTLMEWELHPSRSSGEADLDSLDAALDEIALNSRYNETDPPGDFYGGTHPDLEGR
jgi:hypothetical protein